ncbi:MAG: DUF2141 domain-containing protein [Bacteroidales bacterium]|jgi:uncharacterized protein (DUF2141 family)
MKTSAKITAMLITFTFLLFCPSFLISQNLGKVEINFTNLKNNDGVLFIALYESSPNRFNSSNLTFKKGCAEINKDNTAKFVFENITPGKYAVAVLHDANNDGKMNSNVIGLPKEGFGFSTNPKVLTRSPRMDECEFLVEANKTTHLTIKLIYF